MRRLLATWLLLCAALYGAALCLPARSQMIGEGVWKTVSTGCVLPTFSGALTAHWTADSGITQSGGFVSAWADTTASIALSQATGANQPQYNATGYNSKPALTLHGSGGAGFTSSMMQTSSNAVSLGTNSSWFLVGQQLPNTDATGFGRLLTSASGTTGDGAANNFIVFARNGTAAQLVEFASGVSGAAFNVTNSTNFRFGVTFDGTTISPYLNNVAQTTSTHGATTTSTVTVGIGANLPQSGANVWSDAIEREILVYNIVLNGTQLNTVDAYLTCNDGT